MKGEILYHNLKNKKKSQKKRRKVSSISSSPCSVPSHKENAAKKTKQNSAQLFLFCLPQPWQRHSSISNRNCLQPALYKPTVFLIIPICCTHRSFYFSCFFFISTSIYHRWLALLNSIGSVYNF